MALTEQEQYKLALRKTSNWQLLLVVVLGVFTLSLVLLLLGEITTSYYIDWGTKSIFGIMGLGLCWAGYFWSNLLRTVLATKRYLKTEEEAQLLNAYHQQRLFWRNIALMTGMFMGFMVCVFIYMMARFGIR